MDSPLRKYNATTEQIAELLDYTVDHVRTLAREGSLPAIRFGRRWRFNLGEIENNLLGQQETKDAQTDQSDDDEDQLRQIVQ